ncbi:hypothetical protein [Halomonas sp. SL1]|uniref:hypothetical protein n=1 Tax=Halomonas sp. SL1 TaxID=2137478 RepID=UPI000D16F379|nr:hypothetical protein [Halomonas sp. SL1]RAH36513.1 hypothetical protein C9J49_015865 [Halomonas sp. SL1]
MTDMTMLSNDAPVNLFPVQRVVTDETSSFDRKTFVEGYRRILNAELKLAFHEIPAGNLQAVVLTAVHALPLLPENFEVFRRGIHPLSTDHAGDFIRYVSALEKAVDMVLADPCLTPEELHATILEDFCPDDQFDLEVVGTVPIYLLPMEVWAE